MKRLRKSFDGWPRRSSIDGAADAFVLSRSLLFTLFALVVAVIHFDKHLPELGVELTPFEVGGVVLGALIVLRTNAGYERWWEGRKLWGSIVNQSRNLAASGLAHGPTDLIWRDRFVRWSASFGHATRGSLRGEREIPEINALLGQADADLITGSHHMPSFILKRLAVFLNEARGLGLDPYAFLELDRQRSLLMDHVGGCERISKTPLPKAYAIQIRRFIIIFLIALPFGLIDKIGWLTPLATLLVSYPLLALDKIGVELQSPFSVQSLNHLPLDQICLTIERDLMAMLEADRGSSLSETR